MEKTFIYLEVLQLFVKNHHFLTSYQFRAVRFIEIINALKKR